MLLPVVGWVYWTLTCAPAATAEVSASVTVLAALSTVTPVTALVCPLTVTVKALLSAPLLACRRLASSYLSSICLRLLPVPSARSMVGGVSSDPVFPVGEVVKLAASVPPSSCMTLLPVACFLYVTSTTAPAGPGGGSFSVTVLFCGCTTTSVTALATPLTVTVKSAPAALFCPSRFLSAEYWSTNSRPLAEALVSTGGGAAVWLTTFFSKEGTSRLALSSSAPLPALLSGFGSV